MGLPNPVVFFMFPAITMSKRGPTNSKFGRAYARIAFAPGLTFPLPILKTLPQARPRNPISEGE